MAEQYERQESIRRAVALLEGGYEVEYIYNKLIQEGFSDEDAQVILIRISDKPLDFSFKTKSPAPQASSESTTPTAQGELGALLHSHPQSQSTTQTAPVQKSNAVSDARRMEGIRKAAALLDSGYDSDYAYKKLVKDGFSERDATTIVSQLMQRPRAGQKMKNDYSRSGGDNSGQVMIGIAMIVIGLGITFFSYQAAASNPNGGTYVVTFGLVIAGAFRVLRGLSG